MFSRIIRWGAALAVSALVASSANATTYLTMGASNTLANDTDYYALVAYGGNPSPALSGNDTYSFSYNFPPVLTAADTTTNLSVHGSGFTALTVSWILPDNTVAATVNALAALNNAVKDIDLPLVNSLNQPWAGTYRLVVHWALGANTRGSYSTEILTPFVANEGNPLPLPPALLLFGSALVGLGALGRRKRQAAKI